MNYTAEEIENLCILLQSTKIDTEIVRNYISEVLHLDLRVSEDVFELSGLDIKNIDELYEELWIFDGDDDYEYYPVPYRCDIDEQINYDYVRLEYMQDFYHKCLDDSHLESWCKALPTLKHKRLWIEDRFSFKIIIADPEHFFDTSTIYTKMSSSYQDFNHVLVQTSA